MTSKHALIDKIIKRLQSECVFPVSAYFVETTRVILREELK